MAETLSAGDLTTAFAKWLDGVATDKNTQVRDRLTTNYGYTPPQDTSSLLAKFLKDRA